MKDTPSAMEETREGERTRDLYGKICGDITARSTWYERQKTWYTMRHDGIRRRNKPWAHAADMHYPLADTAIEKLKPFYLNQLFGTDVIAQFIAKDPAFASLAQKVGYWFDYKLKQEANIEREVHIGIDKMLMAGHVPIKVGWDMEKKALYFDAFEPTHCIVPEGTEDLKNADRITFVHHLSPDAYRRDARFKLKSDEFVKRITGVRTDSGASETGLDQLKQLREGITHNGKDAECVIIWEVWENTADAGWHVHFFSPMAPGEPVRPSQKTPYSVKRCPVVRFDVELKGKGHYESRGIVELAAPFEASLNKTWNSKHDAMELYNVPRFTSDRPIPNTGNMRFMPGQILPGNVQPVQSPNRPPISFDEDMNNTQGVAERRIGVPDSGIGNANDKNEPRTATENKLIAAQQSMSVELRSRTFRLALAELLQIAWEIQIQHDKDTQYYVAGQLMKLPQEALASGLWMVKPNGSSESWNKPARLQKAVGMYQMFGPGQGNPAGSPYVKQDELVKNVLEADDPRNVDRLFQDPNAKARDEYEDEANLIPSMLLGMAFMPKQEQDQATRIKAVMDFIAAQDAKGAPLPPEGLLALRARADANMTMLQQKNPQQAAQVQQAMMAQAQNVIQMQPGSGPDPSTESAPSAAAPIQAGA